MGVEAHHLALTADKQHVEEMHAIAAAGSGDDDARPVDEDALRGIGVTFLGGGHRNAAETIGFRAGALPLQSLVSLLSRNLPSGNLTMVI